LNLRELALFGRRFTWESSAKIPTFEKLDRILVSTDWEKKFLVTIVEALTRELSDHTPLLLNTGDAAHRGNTHKFKF
jgi:endonuclease/exonuclease/phosphatase family metal-dependent hydrolase